MSVLRRFRDTLTGRYTTSQDADARPAGTVGEVPSRDRRALNRIEALAASSTTGMVSTSAIFDALGKSETTYLPPDEAA